MICIKHLAHVCSGEAVAQIDLQPLCDSNFQSSCRRCQSQSRKWALWILNKSVFMKLLDESISLPEFEHAAACFCWVQKTDAQVEHFSEKQFVLVFSSWIPRARARSFWRWWSIHCWRRLGLFCCQTVMNLVFFQIKIAQFEGFSWDICVFVLCAFANFVWRMICWLDQVFLIRNIWSAMNQRSRHSASPVFVLIGRATFGLHSSFQAFFSLKHLARIKLFIWND